MTLHLFNIITPIYLTLVGLKVLPTFEHHAFLCPKLSPSKLQTDLSNEHDLGNIYPKSTVLKFMAILKFVEGRQKCGEMTVIHRIDSVCPKTG